MMTPEQVTEIFNRTRPFTYQAFAVAIEQAARREALDYVAQWLEMSDAPLSRKEAADAIRALMGEEG